MRHVGNFDTRNPDRLSENLDRLQANVEAETQQIRDTYLIEPVGKVFAGLDPLATFGVGLIALADTTTGNLTIGLSKPDVPGFAALAKRVAANTAIVVPLGSNGPAPVLINGSANKAYTAVGLYWLFFDGLNWYG